MSLCDSKVETLEKEKEVKLNYDKYLRKIKRRNEMPLSQKWYKNKQTNLSKRQKMILSTYWNEYGITLQYGRKLTINCLSASDNLSKNEILQEKNHKFSDKLVNKKIILDIGFGTGDSIINMASNNPNNLYIGCEIHRPGIASTLSRIKELNLKNVKLIRSDATILFEEHLPDNFLDEICVYFPDPWPNHERDGERRVVRDHMMNLFYSKLKSNGIIRIVTDVDFYANHTMKVINNYVVPNNIICDAAIKSDNNQFSAYDFNSSFHQAKGFFRIEEKIHHAMIDTPIWRTVTNYERKAAESNSLVWNFVYKKLM
eukprot:gene9109-12284_t